MLPTLEIEAILDNAHHKAACLAAHHIRKHLRCFNLARHKLGVHSGGFGRHFLTLGERAAWSFNRNHAIAAAIREAGAYVDSLPLEVQARLDAHL